MSELVQKLCLGDHPVSLSTHLNDGDSLKRALERGFVLVRFTGTQGGTELGFTLDRDGSELSLADFSNSSGTVKLAGRLVLDFVPVRCIVEIDVKNGTGLGRLELLAKAEE
jgi:hypothetical protein